MRVNGIQCDACDLNWRPVAANNALLRTSADSGLLAASDLVEMNKPYFAVEDELMCVAGFFRGRWNAQLGLEYEGSPQRSSRTALGALEWASPFDLLYKNTVIPQVMKQQPQLLGLCIACVYQIIPALQLCRMLRGAGYSGFIVLGGNTISRLVKEMAIPPVFDLVDGLITFQGEVALLKLCQAVEHGKPLDSVPQLVWRDHSGAIHHNTSVARFHSDEIPTPDYTGLPVGQYWGVNYLNLVAARGCYYGKCDFCAIPYGWGNGGYSGIRSVELVFRDMLTLMERHGLNRFKFVDEALSPVFMRALSERIIADGVDVEWEGYVRLEPVWNDRRFVNLVGRAGFRKGYFGLEVVPSEHRAFLNKGDRPLPEILLANCAEAGVKVHFFCMFGFPGTGEEEAKRTTEFLLAHRDDIDTADIFPWTYAKHTKVAGVEPITGPDNDWALEFRHRSLRPDAMDSEEIEELTTRYEEIIWDEVPRMLHPTYRLVSPWSVGLNPTRQKPAAELTAALC